MRRDIVELAGGTVAVYGHYGRPVLVFPTSRGTAHDYESFGMVSACAGLIDAGRVKLYCVDSYDASTWFDHSLPLEERARRHAAYETWVTGEVLGFLDDDCNGPQDVLVTGCSLGAFHAANFALKHAVRFPRAVCLSGVYDPSWWSWGSGGDAAYFSNPTAYVAGLSGDDLASVRSRVDLVLVCGQGSWEDTTGALSSTRAFGDLLAAQRIRHELDLWGFDVPHDWGSWRAQISHHLPRFC